MRIALFLSAAALASAATAQEAPPQDQEAAPIVVTGRTLADLRHALEACIARRCPPDEDIAATISYAEGQFVSGNYRDARATLTASRSRNKRYAKLYPLPVGDLLRGKARVEQHLGDRASYLSDMLASADVLRNALGRNDARALVAKIEVGDAFASSDRYELATRYYDEVAAAARANGIAQVEGFAMLRKGSLWAQLAAEDYAGYGQRADDALDTLIASPKPEHAPFARAARVFKARLAAQHGDTAAADAVIADLRAQPTRKPFLIASEPIQFGAASLSPGPTRQGVEWMDVNFWVAPDGRTTDVDVLRQSGGVEPALIKAVVDSIRSRRYARLKRDPSDPGILRVERYSFAVRTAIVTGSRIPVRDPRVRVEMLDLSTDDARPRDVKTAGAPPTRP